jgi:hypothetical protein
MTSEADRRAKQQDGATGELRQLRRHGKRVMVTTTA